MSGFMELAKKRRSIRRYTGEKIDRKDLDKCVEAARYSPSACNNQPWKFIIVDDPQKTLDVAKRAFSRAYKMNTFVMNASAFIVIVSEKQKLAPMLGGIARGTDFRLIDTGIACEHIVLQATELGIGTCILGWFDEKGLKRLLSVPRNRKIDLVISIGPPQQIQPAERRLKDFSSVVSYNGY